ncbi:MAG: type II toxin-antitoxin system RelE/ParE family toxin [Idiomarina sp.]
MDILKTAVFDEWFKALKDIKGRARIMARIDRLAFGHFGDIKPIGSGIRELRIFYGPGYRIYFKQYGETLIVLLAGGDKSSQQSDIKKARKLATRIEAQP